MNIAIDGPAGAGKSTIAKEIAKKLGFIYLDTGAMYRAMAVCALNNGIDPNDEKAVIPLLGSTNIEVKYLNGEQRVFVNGNDVSEEIRRHEISRAASDISRIPAVRLKLVELQREIAAKNDVVLDGRDITSYVLPNAEFKFFLTAAQEERAKRRCLQLEEKGTKTDFDTILKDIIERDYNDSHRAFAPLTKTEDSILIDSTFLTKDEVVAELISIIEEAK